MRTDSPAVSRPARPARPAICLYSAGPSSRRPTMGPLMMTRRAGRFTPGTVTNSSRHTLYKRDIPAARVDVAQMQQSTPAVKASCVFWLEQGGGDRRDEERESDLEEAALLGCEPRVVIGDAVGNRPP